MATRKDVIIIGGGIVGLATAYRLTKRHPKLSIGILEKEIGPAYHQTGHNSGVLHSGIYYKPGSLKARNCREGKLAMQAFCEEEGIRHELCGKVIVALGEEELPAMDRIFQRGQENGVKCELISRTRLLELEPHCAGIKAIHVPEAGIVDYKQVCRRLVDRVTGKDGNEIFFSNKVTSMYKEKDGRRVIETNGPDGNVFESKMVVNCAGLYSDKVAELSGQDPGAKIIPFRGEYFELNENAKHFCKNLIYPVPDPQFPFLGVHFTRMIDGSVECGPNAVLAFAREGYTKFKIHFGELFESLTYPGFLRMISQHWRMGMGEMWRSISKSAFVSALQRLVPEIEADHLHTAPAGIRAQAVADDGSLVDDFLILEEKGMINVCNAPSPAATASLTIGDAIVDRLQAQVR